MSFFSEEKELIRVFKEYLKKKNVWSINAILKNGDDVAIFTYCKQKNIQNYQNKYGYKLFIETGTYLGDMMEAQKEHFEKLISIELSAVLHQKAMKRFEQYSHINILQGDSGIVINEIINSTNEPALFWLDGHIREELLL